MVHISTLECKRMCIVVGCHVCVLCVCVCVCVCVLCGVCVCVVCVCVRVTHELVVLRLITHCIFPYTNQKIATKYVTNEVHLYNPPLPSSRKCAAVKLLTTGLRNNI